MKITKMKTIYQISFLPTLFPVNCYLIEEERSLTLIDTALPFSTIGILNAAKQIGKPITRIILTHAHNDHVGSLDRLSDALPNVEVLISERDSRLMSGDRSLDSHEPNTPIKGGVPKSLKRRADTLLQEGDEIGSLLAISTPGHTPGSFSFLDNRNKVLMAGDAFQTRGGLAVSGQLQPFFPFPAFGTWNKQVSLESALKVLKLAPSHLAVGHGRMISEPLSKLEKAIEIAKQKI